jgi:hypothetical protein
MFVFDAARGVAVLFGGEDFAGRMLDDTWTWHGMGWTARSPQRHPSARDGASGVYDSLRRVVWLFGGFSTRSTDGRPILYHDMWNWDGANWTNSTPTLSPEVISYSQAVPRAAWGTSWVGAGMVFDEALGNVVLVGQFLGPTTNDTTDTWAWDGSAWSVAGIQGGPQPPGYLFYDPSVGLVVFVWDVPRDAGNRGLPPITYEWFTWDGTGWSVSFPMPQNPNRYGISGEGSAYDPLDRVLVTFGGAAPNSCLNHKSSVAVDETWQWGGAGWKLADTPTKPPARFSSLMAWDSARHQVVMFGGVAKDTCA